MLTDHHACILLNMISGIGAVKFQYLCHHFEGPANIFKSNHAELNSLPGIGRELADKICNWQHNVDLEHELSLVEKAGVSILTYSDSSYPAALRELNDFPLCLYVRGDLRCLEKQTVAIVGSRRITSYGRKMATHLAEEAAYADWCVVSGLAYGIDGVAHQACLKAGGKTVAVLGGGLTRIHPQDHVPLARAISENGAVISEFPMTYAPSKTSFPMRNRIISGLSQAVLIVEAGFKSGSLITANFALEQGRNIFAVPGHADCPQARGCHALIKQGAKLTESFDDVLEDFEFFPGFAGRFADDSGAEMKRSITLSAEEEKIYNCLALEPKSIDLISSETGLPVGALLAVLMKMEVRKLIEQRPGKVFSVINS